LVFPQAYEVNPEGHVPVNICIIAPDEIKLDPIELKSIVAMVVVAVNLYHTSSSGFPVAQPMGMPLLAVALQTVPELFVAPFVSVIAPEQSSFVGDDGLVTQMLKVPLFAGNPTAPE
jgi:hypothetical protein